jgi:Protein of unknown function (DUF3604)
MKSTRARTAALVTAALPTAVLLLASCSPGAKEDPAAAAAAGEAAAPAPAGEAPNPNRNAYFGDLHVHTRYSFDAFIFGTTADANQAYEFAKGGVLLHPAGFEMKLDRPLDFQAVTDHGMYLGMVPAMTDPDSPAYQHPEAEALRGAKTADERRSRFLGMMPYLRGDEGTEQYLDKNVVRGAWAEIIAAAERHNDPGKFTAFIGYEYTSAGEDRDNLHRNVIFRDSKAPTEPFTRLDSANPEDLWAAMDRWRAEGIDSLAIPHNSNGSGGRMFEREYYKGGAIDDAYTEIRMRNEPVVEVTQVKGTSDTHPALSPNDEWANFEIMPYKVATVVLSQPEGSYVRDAYLRGLALEDAGVANPYKFGLIGSSDTHVGAGSFEEANYWSKTGLLDATPELRGSVPGTGVNATVGGATPPSDPKLRTEDGSGRTYRDTANFTWSASGLAGVWAEENTRESLFQALRRKETFATTGPRMRVRFFAGAKLAALDLDAPDLVTRAYAEGVPMGSDLSGSHDGSASASPPAFLVWAMRDPLAAPLQRVQIIKGWTEGGQPHEEIFDVACSDGLTVDPATRRCPDNGAKVDLATCQITADSGAEELKAVWTDPGFDPERRAFYYVRVLENPTCRWSTWDAIREGVEPRRNVSPTIQERAWSSPIWYVP